MNFCTKCGEKLDEGDRFCPKCGLDLAAKKARPTKLTAKQAVLAILVLLAAGGTVTAYLTLRQPRATPRMPAAGIGFTKPEDALTAFLDGWTKGDYQLSARAVARHNPHPLFVKAMEANRRSVQSMRGFTYDTLRLDEISPNRCVADVLIKMSSSLFGDHEGKAKVELVKARNWWKVSAVTGADLDDMPDMPLTKWFKLLTEPEAVEKELTAQCMNNVKQLGTALAMYVDDYGGSSYPPASDIKRYLGPYARQVGSDRLFRCPTDLSQAGCSYALNPGLASQSSHHLANLSSIVAITDVAADGRTIAQRHNLKGVKVWVVGFADGHCESLETAPSW